MMTRGFSSESAFEATGGVGVPGVLRGNLEGGLGQAAKAEQVCQAQWLLL